MRLGSLGTLAKTQFTRSSVTGYPKYVESDTNFGDTVVNPAVQKTLDQLQSDIAFIKAKVSK